MDDTIDKIRQSIIKTRQNDELTLKENEETSEYENGREEKEILIQEEDVKVTPSSSCSDISSANVSETSESKSTKSNTVSIFFKAIWPGKPILIKLSNHQNCFHVCHHNHHMN